MTPLRFVLLLSACALTFATGCEEKTLTRPPPDAGEPCAEGEQVVQGVCRFVCTRDSQCGTSERCNLFTGECEPRPEKPDAGVVTFPCTTGATRCNTDGNAVEICTEAKTWTEHEVCPQEGLCLGDKCLACQPGAAECAPGDATRVLVCLDDGSGKRTIQCKAGATCVEAECRACAPGDSRCSTDGKALQTCQSDPDETLRWTFKNAGDDFDGTCITEQCISAPTPMCKAPDCFPGATRCGTSALQLETCSLTGSWTTQACSSVPGMTSEAVCLNGGCIDECAEAVKQKSYFGCEYWTAVQDNSAIGRFFKNMPLHTDLRQGTTDSDFAFVVSNRSEFPTVVQVRRWMNGAETIVKTVNVPGKDDVATKGVTVIKVPWQSIGHTDLGFDTVSVSGRAPFAYKLTSTRPITVYQFNPLDAVRVTNKTCSGTNGSASETCNELPEFSGGLLGDPNTWGICNNTTGAKRCHYYTYSNDASLLLPAHALGTSYVVISNEHSTYSSGLTTQQISGHATIVASEPNTVVTVRSSARTTASPSGYTPAVPALNKGQTATYTLNAYDVLQLATDGSGSNIECKDGVCRRDNDLTGTVVTSTKPVAVFGGASCALKRYYEAACDHLEEQIFPFATWGKNFVALKSHALRLTNGNFASQSQQSPDHYKIVASCPASQCPSGTLITFSTPPAAGDVLPPNRCLTGSLDQNNCRLAGGTAMEFRSKANFTIAGDQPIAVGQFFTGQNATPSAAQGDPSFILLPPVEQWRADYAVLTAPGIKDNYLGIVYDAKETSSVLVNGTAVTGFTNIPGTTLWAKNEPVSVGVHTIVALAKPGEVPSAAVTVYGFDAYVSYGYTGGLDLGAIVTGIDPGG